jgi:hypothetical protein
MLAMGDTVFTMTDRDHPGEPLLGSTERERPVEVLDRLCTTPRHP